MSYCAVRCEKIKTMTHLGKAYSHNHRSAPVPNADRDQLAKNEVLIDLGNVTDSWNQKVGSQKYRSDAVLGIQVTLVRSPEWVGDERAWTKASQGWLEKEFGKENVLSSVVHRDEKTPHLQALVVPLVQGKLNAKAHLGGAAKLAKMQTSYANAMASLGLTRGSEWSQATHGDIHDHYQHVQKAQKTVPTPPKTTVGIVRASEAERVHAEAVAAHHRAVEAERERDSAKKRAEESERKLALAKDHTEQLRALDLALVAELLGAEQDRSDKQKWTLPSGDRVVLEKAGSRYHLVQSGGGGRGAVDLVMRGLGVGFNAAVSWLSQQFSRGSAAAELRAHSAERLVVGAEQAVPVPGIPTPAPEHWEGVRKYLTETRFLAVSLVERLHSEGRIYADAFRNAVFAHRDPSGVPAGVELRGTGPERFVGARGKKSGFFIEVGSVLMICESAVDALSAVQQLGCSAVSVGGHNRMAAQEWAQWARAQGRAVYAGHDADRSGEAQAAALISVCPWVQRWAPSEGADWNEALVKASVSVPEARVVEPEAMSPPVLRRGLGR